MKRGKYKKNEQLLLYRKYNPEEYPKYYNYNAINVDKCTDIPMDFRGVMGVPITFMGKYNPEHFKIIGLGKSKSGTKIGVRPYTEEHKKYRTEVQKKRAVNGDLYMLINGIVTVPNERVLIKNKRV